MTAVITMEANLTNRDAVAGPQPYVKWSPRAEDVPQAIARATHHASLPPSGPALVSIPMEDWDVEADEDLERSALARALRDSALPDPEGLEELAGLLNEASKPAFIAGPSRCCGSPTPRTPATSGCSTISSPGTRV